MAKNIPNNIKDITKYACNPLSQGILYFCFALSLWANNEISNQITGIAIFLTGISVLFFIAVFSESMLKLMNKMFKGMALLAFLAFVYGFVIGWLQTISDVSGIAQTFILYFGFAWVIAVLLTEVKDITHKKARILCSLTVVTILLAAAGLRFFNHDYVAGSILIIIALLIMLVAFNWLKVHGSAFE